MRKVTTFSVATVPKKSIFFPGEVTQKVGRVPRYRYRTTVTNYFLVSTPTK